MRRGQYFFIALLSAALSFGLLTAVNPEYSGMRYGCNPHGHWHSGYSDSNNRYDHPPQTAPISN